MTKLRKSPISTPERVTLYVAWHTGNALHTHSHHTVTFQKSVDRLVERGFLARTATGEAHITEKGVNALCDWDAF